MDFNSIASTITAISVVIGFLWSVFMLLKKAIEFFDSVTETIKHMNALEQQSLLAHKEIVNRQHEQDVLNNTYEESFKTLFKFKDKVENTFFKRDDDEK